jgi:hypothetical protein
MQPFINRKEPTMPVTNIRAICLPYSLHQLNDKSWIVLNRNRKPLGSGTEDYVTFEDVDPKMRIAKITPNQGRLLSCSGEVDGTIYLYNEGCVPTDSEKNMEGYLQRLAVLMKLRISTREAVFPRPLDVWRKGDARARAW